MYKLVIFLALFAVASANISGEIFGVGLGGVRRELGLGGRGGLGIGIGGGLAGGHHRGSVGGGWGWGWGLGGLSYTQRINGYNGGW